jgi:hypothetical protein
MQDQQTLTLPVSGKTVIIKGYVTGLIDQEVQNILASANSTTYEAPIDASGQSDFSEIPQGSKAIIAIDGTAQLRADQKLLELMLVAVDGDNGANIIDKLLALPKTDVDFVKTKVKELQTAGEVKASDPKAPAN